MNNVLIGNEYLEDLYKGFLHTCNAVSETLGAEGKLAILESSDVTKPPTVTKDGVSVASYIRFSNSVQNFGATLAKQVAARTLEKSGDSTTTSLVFSKAFLNYFPEGVRYNKAVERGINEGYKEVLSKLKKLSQPTTKETLERIAVISANNDEKLGSIIVEAYDAVGGTDGIVEVRKKYDSNETYLVKQRGMKVEKGYHSPFFINNEKSVTWEAEDVLVAVCESWVSDDNIKNFIRDNRYRKNGTLQPMLLVLEKVEDINFIMDLEKFAKMKLYDVCLISTPDVEKFKKLTHLQDIATYTGAEIYTATEEHKTIVAGKADSVVVNSETTQIIKNTVSDEVTALLDTLKGQVTTSNDVEFLRKRIQRLEGKSCIINVGGYTSSEVDERYDRVDDSLKSVKSSIEEGWIPGGGSTLVYISAGMKQTFKNKDEQSGYDLVKEVIKEPFKQILKNANRREPTFYERLFKGEKGYINHSLNDFGIGYNAKTDRVSDLVKDGVIDSTKSIRVAFDSAKSMAEKLLNVGVVVCQSN